MLLRAFRRPVGQADVERLMKFYDEGSQGAGGFDEGIELMTTAVLRATGGTSNSGRINIPNPEGSLNQAALRSPTVFNFYEPNFVLPGAVAEAGLYAPEYQILNDTTAITDAVASNGTRRRPSIAAP